jgi:hypothetical protein
VAGDGTPLAAALTLSGDGKTHAPRWQILNYQVPEALAGMDVSIELRATDAGADSTLEAGVDQVRIIAP